MAPLWLSDPRNAVPDHARRDGRECHHQCHDLYQPLTQQLGSEGADLARSRRGSTFGRLPRLSRFRPRYFPHTIDELDRPLRTAGACVCVAGVKRRRTETDPWSGLRRQSPCPERPGATS
jgi:hypothetical protein